MKVARVKVSIYTCKLLLNNYFLFNINKDIDIMKITAAIALLLGKASAGPPPANGNFFYMDFPDLQQSDKGHGQHEVQMKV